jgi:hypothetical protein
MERIPFFFIIFFFIIIFKQGAHISIALLGNGIFYSISRDNKQPIKLSELNEVLYKLIYFPVN